MHSVRLFSHREVRSCCLQHGGTRKTYIMSSETSQAQKGEHLIVHSDAESETVISQKQRLKERDWGLLGLDDCYRLQLGGVLLCSGVTRINNIMCLSDLGEGRR